MPMKRAGGGTSEARPNRRGGHGSLRRGAERSTQKRPPPNTMSRFMDNLFGGPTKPRSEAEGAEWG